MAHGRGKSGLQHPLGWISIDVANVRGLVSATKLGGPDQAPIWVWGCRPGNRFGLAYRPTALDRDIDSA